MNKETPAEYAARIAKLNDAFRTTGIGGEMLVTRGVLRLGDRYFSEALERVRTFADFTPANDPHGEHDFGSFQIGDTKLFWKIDYYDAAKEWGSSDPANPEVTTRVLTIMLSDEY